MREGGIAAGNDGRESARPVLSREKRKPENPQIFRLSFYNNRSAKDAQSEAEGILNRFANIIQNDIPLVRSF